MSKLPDFLKGKWATHVVKELKTDRPSLRHLLNWFEGQMEGIKLLDKWTGKGSKASEKADRFPGSSKPRFKPRKKGKFSTYFQEQNQYTNSSGTECSEECEESYSEGEEDITLLQETANKARCPLHPEMSSHDLCDLSLIHI